jgi:hypothetical protein
MWGLSKIIARALAALEIRKLLAKTEFDCP